MKKKNGNEQLKILTNQNNSGITLLVLVITIIILAGATIAVLNNADMIEMTKETASDYEKEEEKEQIRIAFANQLLKHQEVIFEDFKNELEKTNSNFNVYGEEEKVIIDSSKTDTRYVIDLDTGEVIEMGGAGNNPINPEKTYQIRYDGNGADGGSMGTISYKLPGAKTVKENQYTKTGYTFSGWNTESNGTGTSYGVGEKINLTESPITLYAMWTLKTYNVTFTASGISGATVSTNTLSIPHGSTYRAEGNTLRFSNGQTVTATAPEQTGYTNSLTWSSTSGTITGETTITANFWRSPKWYKVTINANPTICGAVTETQVAYGTTYRVEGNKLIFGDGQTVTATPRTEPGHTITFSNWSSESGTITGETTITANFARTLNTYTVTISSSILGTVSPTALNVEHGTVYTANGNELIFTQGGKEVGRVTATPKDRTGYIRKFNNWTVVGSGSVTGSMEIAAVFTEERGIYTITLDKDGGSGGSGVIYQAYNLGFFSNNSDANNATANDKTGEITTITPPTKKGYTFEGYYTGVNGNGTEMISPGGYFRNPLKENAKNITFYAKWEKNIYSIELLDEMNNTIRTIYQQADFPTKYEDRECIKKIESVGKPEREGYTFNGYRARNGECATYLDGELVNKIYGESQVLTPDWMKQITLKIEDFAGNWIISGWENVDERYYGDCKFDNLEIDTAGIGWGQALFTNPTFHNCIQYIRFTNEVSERFYGEAYLTPQEIEAKMGEDYISRITCDVYKADVWRHKK
mgnify:CR=1 FL=1